MLYKLTKNAKYKKYAEEEYEWLKIRDSTDVGIIYGCKDKQAVEAIGYICPFLMQYAETFNDPKARDMAINQINIYCKYGVEERSGLPASVWKRYPPYNSISTYSWGRGNSWFSIGILAIDNSLLQKHSVDIITRYCQTLSDIYRRNGCFHQFLDDPRTDVDMCAELPLLYFLYKKGYIELHKQDLLKYSRYMKDGIIFHSSGVFQNPGSPCNIVGSSNRLSQAYLLKLINETP